MNNNPNKVFKVLRYILPSLVAGAVFVIVLALNGLWPFGKETIDYYDMAQWADVFYYHNFDAMRGFKSFLFDWYMNLGRPIPGPGYLSAFDLLMYFVPRDSFLQAMSFLMAVKIMAAAFTMNLFVRYINENVPYIYRLMLSAGYGLCGFVIVNYTAPQWIDMVVLVPLLLMYCQKALTTGKITGLSVTIFLLMIDEYYFAVQTIICLFLMTGAFFVCFELGRKRDDDRKILNVFGLAAGVLIGLALSAFSWIPNIRFGLSSARFAKSSGGGVIEAYNEIVQTIEPAYLSRWFSLLGLAFPTALAIRGMLILLKNKEWRKLIYALLCIFMITVQLVLESVHLMLHFGSYVNYPVRNGFMIYCIVVGIGVYSFSAIQNRDMDIIDMKRLLRSLAGIVLMLFLVGGFNYWYKNSIKYSDHDILLFTMGIMAVFAGIHFALIILKNRDLCICIWLVEMLIFGIIMIGKPLYDSPYGNDPEQEGDYIRISDQLVEGFGTKLMTGDEAATRRIKNPDTSLNTNYGEIMRRETLSGWTNLETADQISGAIGMGYSSQLTRLLDSGGNIFSDTVLHITEAVSYKELDDKLFEKVATTKVVTDYLTGDSRDYYLYRNRFEMPFAIPVHGVPQITDVRKTADIINAYSVVMGADDDIANKVEDLPHRVMDDNHEIYEYNLRITGSKTLYFEGECVDTDYYNTRIFVNGNVVPIPSIKEYENELFPAHFNNNTVELGSFDDEQVNIRIDMDISDESKKYEFSLYEIDRDTLAKLCDKLSYDITVSQGRRSLDISINGIDENYKGVLLPVSYDSGWSAKVNGKSVKPENVNGLFMYIPVSMQKSEIYMSYYPPLMKLGIGIAIVGLFCLALYNYVGECFNVRIHRVLMYTCIIAFALIFTVVYTIPIMYAMFIKIF